MKALPVAALGALVALGTGCSQRAADYGEALFQDAQLSDSKFNAFACATCHRSDDAQATVQIGYSLHDSAFRQGYFGGNQRRLIDAVSFCLVYFMRHSQPLDPADGRGRALYEYLAQQSPDRDLPALPFTVVENVADVPRGDAARGAEVYAAACQGCHGEPKTGKGRLTELAVVVPNHSIDYANEHGTSPALVVVEKVRHGQFFDVGGNMPPFSLEALSDADLGALLSYLEL